MTIALVSSTAKQGNVDSVTTSAINTVGANLIVIAIGWYSVTSPSISDNQGNTWTALTTSNIASDVGCKLYYCLNPTTNASHTFTFGPTAIYGGLVVAAFSGVKTASAFDQQNGATSSSASALSTGSVTPTEDNELVIFAAAKGGNTTTVNATSVGSMIGNFAGVTAVTYALGMGYEIQTTATSRNPSLSGSGTSVMAARIATFKAEPTGGSYSLTADAGTYSYTGQTASILATRIITANNGSYTYSGQNSTFLTTRLLTADVGVYSYTGQAATFGATRLLTADNGTYTYTGQDATLSYTPSTTYALTADAGSYSYTGQSATFAVTRLLTADSGTYNYTGQAASLGYTQVGGSPPNMVASVVYPTVSVRYHFDALIQSDIVATPLINLKE